MELLMSLGDHGCGLICPLDYDENARNFLVELVLKLVLWGGGFSCTPTHSLPPKITCTCTHTHHTHSHAHTCIHSWQWVLPPASDVGTSSGHRDHETKTHHHITKQDWPDQRHTGQGSISGNTQVCPRWVILVCWSMQVCVAMWPLYCTCHKHAPSTTTDVGGEYCYLLLV